MRTVPFSLAGNKSELVWKDSLERDFDFYLEHFPEEPGPREIIIPHNPAITREIDVQVGDVLIGEVSTVNNDLTDNVFAEPIGRFADIDEDEPPVHLLVADYPAWFG